MLVPWACRRTEKFAALIWFRNSSAAGVGSTRQGHVDIWNGAGLGWIRFSHSEDGRSNLR